MGRPRHLNCVNTASGISRINEEQRAYDADPKAYERREREAEDYRRQEEEAMRRAEHEQNR